ncbi:RBBP6-like protein [Mya arenaria]|uniref:RBBP6-like protein n=1 Tax=Mya arenaria TaxID=6604 RepID=A0ABY7DL06_MYAAR|nr:RBBP6-like protein [Mya arenaria]
MVSNVNKANSVEYDSVTFDGLAISLRDLKQSIMRKKNMRPEDIDLQVINAQNGEEYSSPSIMIPKNSSLTISRIPVGGGSRRAQEITPTSKKMKWAAFRKETQQAIQEAESGSYNTDKLKQSSDPANASSSEIEKIAQMMKQSTKDFDPANYNYKVPKGTPSTSYTCFKCGKGGHYIQNCPNTDAEGASNSPSEFAQRIKRPTGIPMEHMLVVNEPLPGTYQTHTGQYTVPKIDAEAYATGKKERPPFLPEPAGKRMVVKQKPVPKELKCPLCGDMARDAVLLESDDHICPSCDSMNVSPDGLIANQMLRRAVTNFQNETGYTKIAQKTAAIQAKVEEAAKAAAAAAPVLQKQSVVSVTPSKPPMESGLPSEPPTPTMDEPVRSVSGYQPPSQPPAQHPPTQHQGVAVPTLVGGTLQNRNLQPAVPTSTYGYFPPSVNTSIAPPNMPHYPIPTAFPPPPVIRPFAPPVVLAPPGVPGYPPPTHTAIPPPPINMPKPLSEQEFFEEKQRLIREGTKVVDDPLLKVFANKLEKRGNRSRTRSRTKSRSPPRFRSRTRSRSWELRRRPSPIRRPQDKLLKTVRSKSPPAAKKRRPGVAKDSKRRNESKAKVTEEKSNKTSLLRKDPDLIDISENEGSPEKSVRRNETVKTNKENIPARLLPVGKKGNNITVVLVDSTTNEESKRAESEAEKQDTAAEMDGTKESRTNSEKVKAVEDKKEEVKADIEKAPASEVTTEPKKKKITLKLKSDKVRKSGNEKSSKNESEGDTKTSEKESDAVLSDNKENKKSEKDVKEKQERRPRSSKSRKDQKKRSSSKSDSESPPRFKEPLRMEGDKRFGPRPVADRVERAPPEWERTGDAWAPRILDQRDYRGRGRGVDFRGRGMGPNYRGAQQGPNFRGPPQGTDFRGVPFGDYRGDYRGPPAGHPDFRGYPGYQGPPAPGFPGPFQPGGYPPPPPVPVMDPREDPNYHGSPERSKDRRERDSDRRSDRRRSERDSISPDRKLDRSTDRTRDSSTSPDRLRSSQTEDDQRDTSPEQKRTDKERRKDKKAKKRKEKGEVGEKKKRKKKDKVKTKKEKADKKGKKVKKVKSSDEEPIQPVVKKSKKQESDDSEISDLETVEPRKRHDSSAQSESSDHEDIEKVQLSPVRQESREDVVETDGKTVEQETIVSSSVSAKEEREAISEQAEKPEPASDSEVSQSDAVVEPSKKRRSIKRLKEEDTEDAKASKKVKLEIDVDKAETQVKSEKMDVSGDQSDESSDLDEIPVPESELMLDPPELSKWEKDDDPYELSPEPTRVKQKWKPEKQTLLPRAVIAKAENVISSKVMKPTLVSSAVVAAVKKDTKTEILEKEVLKKREKSPVPKMDETLEPKRRVYMDSEPKRSDERRVSSSKSHNMQVTVSSTGSEKRKVATDKSGGDLREKLREKREKEDRGGRDDRGRDDKVRDTRVRDDRNRVRDDRDRVRDDRDRGDRVRDSRVKDDRDRIRDDRDRGDRVRDDRRNRDESKSTDKKRRDSHHKDRDSRDYDRQDSRGSNKKVSRYDSVVDDSKFEPDYEDESVSEDNSEDSSTDSSSEEETKRKKHKHKKTKHKKDKKQKKKKEKKKKKHKVEKRISSKGGNLRTVIKCYNFACGDYLRSEWGKKKKHFNAKGSYE